MFLQVCIYARTCAFTHTHTRTHPLYPQFTYKLSTVYLALCLILEMEKQSRFGSCPQIENIIIKLSTCLVCLTHMPSISPANRNASSFHKGASSGGHLSQVDSTQSGSKLPVCIVHQ